MSVNLQDTAIMTYLKSKDSQYYGKVLELRESVSEWLDYIPQTFPHYTRHTIRHSEEIVLQLSKLLFKDERQRKPVIRLSAVEAYILIAAAYLHDAGMVASDREKIEILNETLRGRPSKQTRSNRDLRRHSARLSAASSRRAKPACRAVNCRPSDAQNRSGNQGRRRKTLWPSRRRRCGGWNCLAKSGHRYISSGLKPVCFAIRASIFGPISALSWKAKTTSGQPGRERIL